MPAYEVELTSFAVALVRRVLFRLLGSELFCVFKKLCLKFSGDPFLYDQIRRVSLRFC
jgi:hypothetical protein